MKNTSALLFLVALTACQSTPDSSSSETPAEGRHGRPAEGQVQATDQAVAENFANLNASRNAVANDWQGRSFEEFEATVAREPETGNYIVNGDIVLHDRKHLKEFFEKEVLSGSSQVGLIIHAPGGVQAKWSDAAKGNLSYCVSNRFGSRKAQVIEDMAAAGKAWSDQGDVKFVYLPLQDTRCNAANPQVVFDVRPVSGGDYLARAFFPNDSRGKRNVLIDDSSFNPSGGNLTLRGILRHELGHALGFRHEHTRPESGACFEDDSWVPLTSYDAFSVMHYPQCNGQGDWSLTLTKKDSVGICKVYGAGPGFSGDITKCAVTVTTGPDVSCAPAVTQVSDTISEDEITQVGSFNITEGDAVEVLMSGTGDPDVYVRFNAPPTLSEYNCRPYATGASENCELIAPQNASNVQVMVHGYAAGDYDLEVRIAN